MTADQPTYDWIGARLRDLSAGKLLPADEARLRHIAQTDPFVAEALEGYFTVPSEKHTRLLRQIDRRIRKPYRNARRWLIPNLSVTAIAAVFMILLGTWAVLHWAIPKESKQQMVVLSTDTTWTHREITRSSSSVPVQDIKTDPDLAEKSARTNADDHNLSPVIQKPMAATDPSAHPQQAEAPSTIPTSSPALAVLHANPEKESGTKDRASYRITAAHNDTLTKRGKIEDIQYYLMPTSLRFRPGLEESDVAKLPDAEIAPHILVSNAGRGETIYTAQDVNYLWSQPVPTGKYPTPVIPPYPLPVQPYSDFIDSLSARTRLPLANDPSEPAYIVFVTFKVNESGQALELDTAASSAPLEFKEEALRLLQKGPAWKCPGKENDCRGRFTFFFRHSPRAPR